MVLAAVAECVVVGRQPRSALSARPHHPRLGSGHVVPYSAARGQKSMTRDAVDELKRQIPVLDYLHAHDWRPVRKLSRGRWMGLCPLHQDHHPSFVVDPIKGLFYCYGCGRGGDVIRFAEIYHQVRFPQAVALLRQWRGLAPLLQDAVNFYHLQLHRHAAAVAYLGQRGIQSPQVIDHMRIGFPLEGNLYGRSISASAPPHRFLPGSKGGLYRWDEVRSHREVILVEGLFDYAVLWQAGFRNVTYSLGTHLNRHQFRQLSDGNRTVYLAFDADSNGSGQHA